ncbi:phage tail protein, partial [Glaesserella parasuis]|uniref:phage tail protein n=5 Tax=Pasteurellales TaxID=135625 RepID=UPI00156B9D84
MAGLNEIAKWEREVYQIEEDDPVLGGVKGVTNKPLKHLANRTLYLKQVLEAAGQKLMPKKLTATTRNIADSTGHTHEIDLASTTTKGLVQLTNDTGLDSESLALTAKAGKAIAQSVAQLQLSTTNALNQKVNKTDISNAVNSTSQTTVASSQAVKTAYDLANSKYTAQDASPTQKGLVQLANNLTTNDATKALTAAQGKILKDEIDRIEIGGRNLIKNSRLLNDTTHWNVIGGRDVRNGIAVLKSLDTSRQWCWRQ